MKPIDKLLTLIIKMDPIQFTGMARILNVPLVGDEQQPRDFTDVLSDCLEHFSHLSRDAKRNLLSILKAGIKDGSHS